MTIDGRSCSVSPDKNPARVSRGVTWPEVLVVVLVVGMLFLFVLAALPRRRETARLAGCRRNLMQIGAALAQYDRAEGHLPTVPALGPQVTTGSPLAALLETLGLPDLAEIEPDGPLPRAQGGAVVGPRPIPGFTCPSDRGWPAGTFTAPVSYRATTGDRPDGQGGGFTPGRQTSVAEIERADGRAYTAAFAERLIGHGQDGVSAPWAYARVSGPLEGGGCPESSASRWRGDAGSSWDRPGWVSTLYNHGLPPNARPSCVSDDGRTAFMGASSGHVQGVNVLTFDGGVRTVRPSIAPAVWKALATTTSMATPVADSQ